MRIILDLTNERFGKLLVIERAENVGGKVAWLCQCDCGKKVIVKSHQLRSENKTSCGCWKNEKFSVRANSDLTGQRFGRLEAIEKIPKPDNVTKGSCAWWKCKCDCGNEINVASNNLLRKMVKSCGCLLNSHESLVGKKFNRLLVLEENGKNKFGRYQSKCLCDCGNIVIANNSCLRKGYIKSCGCLGKERLREGIINPDRRFVYINRIMKDYKNGAKTRNLEYSISREKFEEMIEGSCFYCGREKTNFTKLNTGEIFYHMGIDRIDSSKGYVDGNVIPCCGRCNMAKMAETQQDFIEWVKLVYENLNEKGFYE